MTYMLVLRHIHYMLKMTAVQTSDSIAVVACAPDFEAAKEVILVFKNVEVWLSTVWDCGQVMSLALLPFVFSCFGVAPYDITYDTVCAALAGLVLALYVVDIIASLSWACLFVGAGVNLLNLHG